MSSPATNFAPVSAPATSSATLSRTPSTAASRLKERTIGIEVFGRSTSYDPSDDATGRVKAGEVRKRLGLYYSSEGAANPVRLELPSGTYVPEFHPGSFPSTPGAPPATPAAAVAPFPPPRSRPLWAALSLGLGLGLVGALAWWIGETPSTPLDLFWSPVLRGSSPVLVCAAFVPVWSTPNLKPGATPRLEDFVPLTDQFVGGGDLIATSRLAAMLTRDPVGITDNGQPTAWALPGLPADRRTNEDYAIVSRVFHPDTHAMLVELAGITQYGTDAAADLVTNPDLMAEALRGAPRGWQKKNLQMVLHVKVIAGAPTSPKVLQTHFW